jgi:L-asparaginase/Glu-tRNA(Gln) amidotransferase subunit D
MHTLRHRIVGFVALALLLVPVLQAREPHPEAPAEERARVVILATGGTIAGAGAGAAASAALVDHLALPDGV